VDANALYYTFSTIAQTLAGALAVLVAFVLFRLRDLDKKIDLGNERLRALGEPYLEARITLRKHGMAALKKLLEGKVTFHPEAEEDCRVAYGASKTRTTVTRLLYVSLLMTALDIAACFVALPATSALICSGWALRSIVTLVGLGIICLLLYVWLIVAMVKRAAA